MTRALIGYTGFVGSNLLAKDDYDSLFNSKNISEIKGRHFTEVVCAGVSALKWQANRDPLADWRSIEALIEPLSSASVDHFILLSTVDVYSIPRGVNEQNFDLEKRAAYGAHRALLEKWVTENFPVYHIVRLPALYGPGLKKNVLYDLQHDNMLDAVKPDAQFQWYDVSRLAQDLRAIKVTEHKLVNIACQPIKTSEIIGRFFPGKVDFKQPDSGAPVYDVQTKYPEILGSQGCYHFYEAEILDNIGSYLKDEVNA